MKSFKKNILTTSFLTLPLLLTACKVNSDSGSSTSIRKAGAKTTTTKSAEDSTDNTENNTQDNELDNILADRSQESQLDESQETSEGTSEDRSETMSPETPINTSENIPAQPENLDSVDEKKSEGKKTEEKTAAAEEKKPSTNAEPSQETAQCLKDLCDIPGEASLKVFIDKQSKITQTSKDYYEKHFKKNLTTSLEKYALEGEAYSQTIKKFENDFAKVKLNEKQKRALKYLTALYATDKSDIEKIMISAKDAKFYQAYAEKVATKASSLKYFEKLFPQKKAKEALASEAQYLVGAVKSINTTVGAPIFSLNKTVITRALYKDALDNQSLDELLGASVALRLLDSVLTSETDLTAHMKLDDAAIVQKISKDLHKNLSSRKANMDKNLEQCAQTLMTGIQIFGSESQILATEASAYQELKYQANSLVNNSTAKDQLYKMEVLSPWSRDKFTTAFSKFISDINAQSTTNLTTVKSLAEPETLVLAVAQSLITSNGTINCEGFTNSKNELLEMIDNNVRLNWTTSHESNSKATTAAISQLVDKLTAKQNTTNKP